MQKRIEKSCCGVRQLRTSIATGIGTGIGLASKLASGIGTGLASAGLASLNDQTGLA